MYGKIITVLWSGSISTPTAILTALTLSHLAMAIVNSTPTRELTTTGREVANSGASTARDTVHTSLPTSYPVKERDLTTSQKHSGKHNHMTEGTKLQGVSGFTVTPPPQNRRQQIEHMFSEVVIIAIILGVMVAIVVVILFIACCFCQLTKKRSFDVEYEFNQGAHLSSVEIENPEK